MSRVINEPMGIIRPRRKPNWGFMFFWPVYTMLFGWLAYLWLDAIRAGSSPFVAAWGMFKSVLAGGWL